jgi:hypothetical protein
MIPITIAPQAALKMPEAARMPLAGSLPYLLRSPFAYLANSWQDQGDIFSLDLGVTKAVILSHPDHVQTVLRDKVRNVGL